MGEYKGMYVIEHGDVISGKMATAFIKKDGKTIPLSWFKSFEAKMEVKKSETARLGTMSMLKRWMGWSGVGSATMYYCTSLFAQMANEFNKTGIPTFVDIALTNDDPATTMGAHSILLKNVSFDDIVLAKFDVESDDPLDNDMDFTFDDFELLETFVHPIAPITF